MREPYGTAFQVKVYCMGSYPSIRTADTYTIGLRPEHSLDCPNFNRPSCFKPLSESQGGGRLGAGKAGQRQAQVSSYSMVRPRLESRLERRRRYSVLPARSSLFIIRILAFSRQFTA